MVDAFETFPDTDNPEEEKDGPIQLDRREGDWTVDFGLSLLYTKVYSSMRVGTYATNWWEGVRDHGPWSQPALCSCHRAVCGRERRLLTGVG